MLELFQNTNNRLGKSQHISKVRESELLWHIHRNGSLLLLTVELEASLIKILDHNISFGQLPCAWLIAVNERQGPALRSLHLVDANE